MNFENSATDFLELSSHQRLSILNELLENKSSLTNLTKKLSSTKSHVHRDLQRLGKAEIIEKDTDGDYNLTTYGKSICTIIPALLFISSNKKYFKTHNFGNLPNKFIQRIGALSDSQVINGYSRVIDVWKKIISTSEKFVYGIIVEEPSELIEPILKKTSDGVKIQSIFSTSSIIPETRKKIVKKFNMKKLLTDEIIQRRVVKDSDVVVLLNEKEACVSFPNAFMESDIGKAFHSDGADFHEWCLDYFRYSWHKSKPLRDEKFLNI